MIEGGYSDGKGTSPPTTIEASHMSATSPLSSQDNRMNQNSYGLEMNEMVDVNSLPIAYGNPDGMSRGRRDDIATNQLALLSELDEYSGPISLFLDALRLQMTYQSMGISNNTGNVSDRQGGDSGSDPYSQASGGHGNDVENGYLNRLSLMNKNFARRSPEERDWYVIGLEAVMVPCDIFNNVTRQAIYTAIALFTFPILFILTIPVLCSPYQNVPIPKPSSLYGDVIQAYQKTLLERRVDIGVCWVLSFSRWPS